MCCLLVFSSKVVRVVRTSAMSSLVLSHFMLAPDTRHSPLTLTLSMTSSSCVPGPCALTLTTSDHSTRQFPADQWH